MDKFQNQIKEMFEGKSIKQIWPAEKLRESFCIVKAYVCNRRQPIWGMLFEIAGY